MTELLMAYCAFEATNSHLVAPVPASREELLLFHSAEYVDAVARLDLESHRKDRQVFIVF